MHIDAGIIKVDLIGYRWVVTCGVWRRRGWALTRKKAEAKREQAIEMARATLK